MITVVAAVFIIMTWRVPKKLSMFYPQSSVRLAIGGRKEYNLVDESKAEPIVAADSAIPAGCYSPAFAPERLHSPLGDRIPWHAHHLRSCMKKKAIFDILAGLLLLLLVA